ncbi:MAG TPA: hypothetical protein VN626_04115 [Clostridia bacterium]|nr:hypothetical protein [Clostridia bacterium]
MLLLKEDQICLKRTFLSLKLPGLKSFKKDLQKKKQYDIITTINIIKPLMRRSNRELHLQRAGEAESPAESSMANGPLRAR